MHRWSDEVPLEATYEALAMMVRVRCRRPGASGGVELRRMAGD